MAAYPISLPKCVTKCNHRLSVYLQKLLDLQRFFGSETHRGQARIWGRYSEQPFIVLFLFLFVRNQSVEFGIEIDRAQVQALSRASRLALFVADAVSWFRVRVEICKVSRNKNKILLGQFLSPASQRMCRINKNLLLDKMPIYNNNMVNIMVTLGMPDGWGSMKSTFSTLLKLRY